VPLGCRWQEGLITPETGAEFSSFDPVHLLIIHPETAIGGAEKVLGYFLQGLSASSLRVTVAIADGPLKELKLKSVQTIIIPDHARFSPSNLLRQITQLNRCHREIPFDIVHGWAARDWELTSLAALIWRRHAVGTLHDHPTAYYIRRRRRRLMRLAARWGLQRVVCVSAAVRRACEEVGYSRDRLVTIHNGLPAVQLTSRRSASESVLRLGYLGALTRTKGIDDLLQIMDRVAVQTSAEWELQIAGTLISKNDQAWLEQLQERYAQRTWWSRVVWSGWINRPSDFLGSLDLLVFASAAFDSFPTVLLEAASLGTPVLASAVGGASEIVEHGLTGWLFPTGDSVAAAGILTRILNERSPLVQAGIEARKRVARKFNVEKMVEAYENLYLTLRQNG